MKRISTLLLSLLVVASAWAETNYAAYYQNLPVAMPVVTAPVIPTHTVCLTDMGGVGNGIDMNTQAFADAITKLSAMGGGHLVVPAGIYLTGNITLKDNIDLHLEQNAMILFSPDKATMVRRDPKSGKYDRKATPGITADGCKNISITGRGMIDGNGEWWRAVKRGKVSDDEWNSYRRMGGTVSDDGNLWYPYDLKHYDNVADSYQKQEGMRVHMIRFTECENVLLEGITLRNSPKFHFVPQRCHNVIIDGVTVFCEWNVQNGDGIDIGNSKDVLVVNNTVSVGDDGICMKGGVGKSGADNGPCENILIMNNTVYRGHGGFVIGSDVSGGMKNIVVRHNTFSGTDTGLRFKSSFGRGGKTSQIFISDIFMNDIKNEAIVFETTYADKHVGADSATAPKEGDYAPDFADIHISDVICRDAQTAIAAHGAKGMVHDITVSHSTFFYTAQATDIDAACDVTLTDVTLRTYEK